MRHAALLAVVFWLLGWASVIILASTLAAETVGLSLPVAVMIVVGATGLVGATVIITQRHQAPFWRPLIVPLLISLLGLALVGIGVGVLADRVGVTTPSEEPIMLAWRGAPSEPGLMLLRQDAEAENAHGSRWVARLDGIRVGDGVVGSDQTIRIILPNTLPCGPALLELEVGETRLSRRIDDACRIGGA